MLFEWVRTGRYSVRSVMALFTDTQCFTKSPEQVRWNANGEKPPRCAPTICSNGTV